MRGFAVDIEPSYGLALEPSVPVVGIAASQNFPYESLRATLRAGKEKLSPDTLWVLRKPRKGSGDYAALEELEDRNNLLIVEPSSWWGKWKSDWFDFELVWGCSKVVVFHKPGSSRTDFFVRSQKTYPHIRIVEDRT